MMILQGDYQHRLEKIMQEYRGTRPSSLYSVLDEVINSVRVGEIVDSYQARYIRDALFSNEAVKASNEDIIDFIEKEFFS